MKIENVIYNKFKDDVLDCMKPNDIITREQIKYKIGLTSMLVDKLLWYIKKNLCTNGFNKNVMCSNEGFRMEFNKTIKGTYKMYIIKL